MLNCGYKGNGADEDASWGHKASAVIRMQLPAAPHWSPSRWISG